MLAVGGRRRVGMARLDMPLQSWHALPSGALPHDFAGGLVQAVNAPAVLDNVLRGCAGTIQAGFELGIWIIADGRRHEHAIIPNDRGGVAQARDGRLPRARSELVYIPGRRR